MLQPNYRDVTIQAITDIFGIMPVIPPQESNVPHPMETGKPLKIVVTRTSTVVTEVHQLDNRIIVRGIYDSGEDTDSMQRIRHYNDEWIGTDKCIVAEILNELHEWTKVMQEK